MRTKLPGRTWIVIVLLALMGQVAWAVENNFFNLFIQDAFGARSAYRETPTPHLCNSRPGRLLQAFG